MAQVEGYEIWAFDLMLTQSCSLSQSFVPHCPGIEIPVSRKQILSCSGVCASDTSLHESTIAVSSKYKGWKARRRVKHEHEQRQCLVVDNRAYLWVKQQCLLILEGMLGGNAGGSGKCIVARRAKVAIGGRPLRCVGIFIGRTLQQITVPLSCCASSHLSQPLCANSLKMSCSLVILQETLGVPLHRSDQFF